MVWFFLVSLEVALQQAFPKEKWGTSHPQEQAFHSSKHTPHVFPHDTQWLSWNSFLKTRSGFSAK
jgi:hypothetical protein